MVRDMQQGVREDSLSALLPLEVIALDQLKPHPRNYRSHPEDEILHLMESIRANGIYKNIVIANEGTILCGRGVTIAAERLEYTHVPVYRAPYGPNDPRAIKLLVSDNEISHLAENDDRALTELLKELKDSELDLLGTGYDEMMLANLVMVSRPASEIADLDAAAQWVGMPEYNDEGDEESAEFSVIVNFATEEHCREFCRRLTIDASSILMRKIRRPIWWPSQVRDDLLSLRFTAEKQGEEK